MNCAPLPSLRTTYFALRTHLPLDKRTKPLYPTNNKTVEAEIKAVDARTESPT